MFTRIAENWASVCGVLMLTVQTASATQEAAITPVELRCEYLDRPLCVDVARPRLSWILKPVNTDARALKQTAYHILVATDAETLARGEGNLWDSGKVASAETVHIEYAGKPLAAMQRATWKVRIWDQADQPSAFSEPSWWAVGLRNEADWSGAQWIGDATPPPPVTPAHNGYHTELSNRADDPKWVQIDLGAPTRFDAVTLHPARPHDWSADVPGLMFPVKYRVLVGDAEDAAGAAVVADLTAAPQPNPGENAVTHRFPPVTARYVRLDVAQLGERNPGTFAAALAEMDVLDGDKIVSLGKPVTAKDSIEHNDWSTKNLTDGDRTSDKRRGYDPLPAPMLRKAFSTTAAPARAIVYATALGLYELRINGQRVGDHQLAPEWTDYHRRVQYQAYDVTALLRQGENVIGATLGDGWYAGEIGLTGLVPGGPPRAIYGRLPALLLKLELRHPDGSRQTIVSDASWKTTLDGPIRTNDLMDGETYDARRELPGWDKPGFDDAAWTPAQVRPAPSAALVAQPNEPIRITRDRAAASLAEPKPGVYVFDLGQNLVGWCRLRVTGDPGTTVTLRHAEVLNPDGTIYTANLRGAAQTDRYILKGGAEETFEPRFTYHGFRYVEVAGLPSAPSKDQLVARVLHSAAPETGEFDCSEPLLNKLWSNILWTQRSNLHSTPTDCPQRDERCGWMGDILAFAPTACFNMNMAAFFTKWLPDTRDAQADDGRFADFSPNPYDSNVRVSGVPAWGDAGVFVPWTAWEFYGDRRLLEAQYPAAVKWVEWIRSKNPDLLWKNARHNDYGDWLNADTLRLEGWPAKGAEVPKEVFATMFFARSTQLLSKMARVLGKNDDAARYEKLAADIRDAFNKAYVTPEGRIEGDTQAGYALALNFDLLPAALQGRAAARMVERFEPYGGQISTGFHSTVPLMLELTNRGYNSEAYRLVLNRKMPSWGYAIDHGATTVWERWDGYVEGRGFQDPGMNSFAHYAIGSVGEWMMKTIIGIQPDPSAPGFSRVILRPQPGPGLTWARGAYTSIRGRIGVAWQLEPGLFRMSVLIPPNVTATVFVPTDDPASVNEDGQPLDKVRGAEFLRKAGAAAVYELQSGTYTIEAKRGGP
ncbi:MAG: family 78 glycoside hydrolase catalytic domain [Phycisphaerae bacterium]|nr:MAG: rhamnosidase [Planctomycetota bacterium]KAB2945991.1 MAG: Bacterial alpha-L-rhamnosidase [Phycisphaerae bacterium]MBE7456213.1 family 78 glycoside hydrolase catalytic domain [Planctomycetia bacterium]MCK6464762.1 family 78 glycoside hydrolase catalytic domain [Phycisphaerae bacterium]MCL4719896.1 family 78 glycoside hydrolase catalytic domain [Phycisphaerae bacterium]